MICEDLAPTPIRVMQPACDGVRSMRSPVVHTYVALALHMGGRIRVEHHGEFELLPVDVTKRTVCLLDSVVFKPIQR